MISIYSFSRESVPNINDLVEHDKANNTFKWTKRFSHQNSFLASQITELKNLIKNHSIPDYPLILCNIDDIIHIKFCNFVIKQKVVIIKVDSLSNLENIHKVYLHKAAHINSKQINHSFIFSVIYNLFLMRCGYMPSLNIEDYKYCDFQNLEKKDVRLFSVKLAQLLRDSQVPAIENDQLIITEINNFFNNRLSIEDLNVNFSRFANMISTIKKLLAY